MPLDTLRLRSFFVPAPFRSFKSIDLWPAVIAIANPLCLSMLCAAWILFSLVGHDPWKPDEAYTFGLVLDFMERGDWVVPTLAGEPFLEKPPLFFITASAFARAFGGWLPLHDAARFASGLYVAIALVFLALTARELHSRRHGWTAVLIMLGCFGLQVRAHQLITDLGLLAGISMGIYGLAIGRRCSIRGGIALGAGTAIAFLCKGLLGPGMLWLTACLLPLSREWRQRNYFGTLSISAVVAIPGIAAWTIALYLRSPDLFATWLIANNLDRFLGLTDIGPHQPRLFYAYTLLWYAFPALPLASWTAWSAWREHQDGWAEPRFLLPIALLLVMLAVLGLAADARELYLMPTLLPFALLATAGMDRIPRGAGIALARLGTGALGLSALALWLGWFALVTGEPSILAKTLVEYQPGYVAQFAWPTVSIAMLATVVWLFLAFPRAVTAQQGITQWTAGITLHVVLVGTLWLSYLNSGKSYHEMIQSMLESIPGDSCVASRYLGEPQRALLRYYGNLLTVREEVDHAARCDVLLVQGWRSSRAPAQSPEWTPVWEGARAGDNKEFYRLYVRDASAAFPIKHFPDARPLSSSTSGANSAQ